MISITSFSKQGLNLVMFQFEFQEDVDFILALEGKQIINLEIKGDIIIGELKNIG